MNCLDHERLFSYAHRLLGEQEAAQVHAHLGECSLCREVVEHYERLDAVLEEWKPAGPSAWFDARVRQAVETQEARRAARGFWGLGWVRGLALASLGVLVIAGVAWLTHRHRSVSTPSTQATQQPRQTTAAQAPAEVAKLNPRAVTPRQAEKPRKPAPELQSAGISPSEDEDARALDDYDLVADFDVLSELPKKGAGVAN
jgi:predicted anti-sigma-YlaC factor YlaD